MIARALSQKTSYKIPSVFCKVWPGTTGYATYFAFFPRVFQEKKAGQRGKKKIKKGKEEGGKDGNEANRDGSSLWEEQCTVQVQFLPFD